MTIAILIAVFAATTAHAQSVDGFAIGQDIQAALAKHDAPAAQGALNGYDVYRWTLPSGNATAVTAAPKTGKIVFVEFDWGGDAQTSAADVPGLVFGASTLAEIRAKFGSNGFVFKQHALHMDEHDIIGVNCYALAARKDQVLALVTTQPVANVPEVDGKPKIDMGQGTLQAVILADLTYLESIWGKERADDAKDHPVEWK